MGSGADRGWGFWLCETVGFCLVLAGVDLRLLDGKPLRVALPPLIAGLAVSAVGFYLPPARAYLKQRRARRRGRMGLLNARVDVPAAMAAQDKRLRATTELIGQLSSIFQAKAAKPRPTTHAQQMALANETAAAFRRVGSKLRREADGFRAETTRFSTGLDRWLEIAESDATNDGFEEQQQVPNLVRMMSSGTDVLPTLREKRQMFEKLRGASDMMDAACGEVVEAFDVLIGAIEEAVATSERSLRRIKAILERFLAAENPKD